MAPQVEEESLVPSLSQSKFRMVALDLDDPTLCNRSGDQLLDSFIFAGNDSMVTDVWSAGRHMVQSGRHVNRDRIEGAYKSVLRKLSTIL